MPDPLLIAVISTGGALLGSIVGAVTTYFVQKKLISAQVSRQTHKELLEKRLVSLQELSLVIDFVYGNVGSTTGGPVGELFTRIVKESPQHLAFLPTALREDARTLMFQFFSAGRGEPINVQHDFMHGLRKRVLAAIDETYELYAHDR